MNLELNYRVARYETTDHRGDIVSVTNGRSQVAIVGLPQHIAKSSALRIGGVTFVPVTEEYLQKELDYEWHSGKISRQSPH